LLPLALLAWDWSGRISWRLMLRRQWPYWALCVLATLALLLHPAYWSLLWNSVHLRDLHTSAPTQLHSSFALLGELAWPAALNFDPDWPQLDGYATLVPQLALLAASLGLAWHFRGTRPWISLGVVWVLLHLFLANTFFPRADIANERQLYWADWGLLLIVAVEQHLWLSRRASWALALILAGALGTLTLARNSVYTSEVALWQDTARKSPHKARVFNNLGYAYQMAGRKEEARQAYLRALALQPDYVKAGNNLDRLEARPGR
jgi:tetratricopeptide (TPR) repeat protein